MVMGIWNIFWWWAESAQSTLEKEPKGGSQDDFELALKGYYNSIHHDKRPAFGRKRRIKRVDLNHFHPVDSLQDSEKGGAALLGVCRGKVSEGIDFSDDNARVVIIVGIPFPNINDIQVALKKKYNDMFKSSKHLLSGNEWYCHQAFRALNQAAGRCIRHKLDYGAIILLDERFSEERNKAFISKWLRRPLRVYDSFDLSLEGLKSFFDNAKERYGMTTVHVTQNSGFNGDGVQNKDKNMRFTRKKNQNLNRSGNGGEQETSVIGDDIAQRNSYTYNLKDHINSQCCNLTERFTGESSVTVADEETSIVKEIPCLDVGTDAGSPDYSKDDNSDSTIIEGSSHFPMDHLSSLPLSSTTGSRTSTIITPEKNVNSNSIPEMESYLNLSVNSHNQKRRKPMITPFINLIEEENDVAPCASTPTWYTKSSVDVRYATHGTECGSGRILNSYSPQLPTSILPGSCSLTVPLLDKRLQIFCSLCKNPLGRPENHLYLTCSLISSSKVHLRSLLEQRLKTYTTDTAKSVPVIVTDSSFVDQHICNRIPKSALEEGIWCPEDGCVFRSIFCPFCSNTNNLLGVQIMATNSSNVQLLDKILFYFDSLEVKNHEGTGKSASEEVDLMPIIDSGKDEVAVVNSIDKYSYIPQPGKSEVWKTRKPKPRLRGLPYAESQN